MCALLESVEAIVYAFQALLNSAELCSLTRKVQIVSLRGYMATYRLLSIELVARELSVGTIDDAAPHARFAIRQLEHGDVLSQRIC